MFVVAIFACVWGAMIAAAFWESSVEGRNAWDKGKYGWKIDLFGFVLTRYHFWLFWVMFPLLLLLPLVVAGWDWVLFGVLLSAYSSGLVLEDLFWFIVNTEVDIDEWGEKFADYYPWLHIGSFRIPWMYILGVLIAILSWWFFWR